MLWVWGAAQLFSTLGMKCYIFISWKSNLKLEDSYLESAGIQGMRRPCSQATQCSGKIWNVRDLDLNVGFAAHFLSVPL